MKKEPNRNGPNCLSTCDSLCSSCCSQIKDLSVTMGSTEIIQDINLHFHCGQMTAIIGPNGAGKSTLLKAIIGEIPYSGRVAFQRHQDVRLAGPTIGYVPQKTSVEPGNPMSVRDLFATAVSKRPVWLFRDKKIDEGSLHALGHMEAAHLYTKRLANLSGGELQRVLVALALTPMPALLLLDEPITGIDHSGMVLFYKMVSQLRRDHDLSIVMISHDLALSAQFADRMILLKKTIIADGKPSDIIAHEKTRELMGFSLPSPDSSPQATDHHQKNDN